MKRWQFWLGLLVSAVFLYVSLRQVDWQAAWQHVLTARWGLLLAGWACLVLSYVVRIWRWHRIVSSEQAVSILSLGQVYLVGLMANNILPARIGEIVRAYLLGQTSHLDGASALGTIAVERVFDVIMALSLLVIGASWSVMDGIGSSVWLGALGVAGIVAGVVVLAVWGNWFSDLLERIVGRFSPKWGTRLADMARAFVRGLRSVGSVVRALQVGASSVAAWGLFMAYAALVLRAFGLAITLPGAAFLLGVGGLGVSIPSAPGNVGTLEGAYIAALTLLGIGSNDSRATFALTYHLVEWVTTCAIGLLCLGGLGLSLGELTKMTGRQVESVDCRS